MINSKVKVVKISNISIASKILLLILISQTLLYGAFSLIIIQSSEKAVRISEASLFSLLNDTVRSSIQDEIYSASLVIESVLGDDRVQKLFGDRNREGLFRYLEPYYEKIRGKVARFHFHLPNGESFLRMHDPGSFGDNLLALRPMITSALEIRRVVSGIELGRDGLGLRVVSPIFDQDTYLGAVEFGMEFGKVFCSRLQEKFDADYYIFLFRNEGTLEFIAGTRTEDRCPLAEKNLEDLMIGKPVWSLDCSKARAVGLYPFADYSGHFIGFIKAEILRIPLSEAVRTMRTRLVVLGFLLIVILGVTVSSSTRALLRPLQGVVSQTKTISERILAGDHEYRGDVEATAPDFREVIEAVNRTIYALRERETILKAVVEGIPGIVFYVDSEYRVVWANSKAKNMCPGIVGSDLHTTRSDFFAEEKLLLERTFSTGKSQLVEACYLEGSGLNRVCWEHLAVPVISESEKVHIIRISSDVSARRITEAELVRLNENLERRIEEELRRRRENEKIAEQQSRLAAIGELATGMAHEITQPLNAISFSFDNLRNKLDSGTSDPEYLKAKCSAVAKDIERIRRVIDHVRLFARSSPEEYRTRFEPGTSLENALSLTGTQLASRQIDSIITVEPDLPSLYGNPYKYEQVILNLLSNARAAIEERISRESAEGTIDFCPGKLEIKMARSSSEVVLMITDNGIGIPAENRYRVFDPFFTTKPGNQGTGLGLSISFGIVRDMGGTIELLPAVPGPGTLAKVSIPFDGSQELFENG